MLYILDYGGGNVRSLVNSVDRLGWKYRWVERPEDIKVAEKLIFPGVGSFGQCVGYLKEKGYWQPLKEYLRSGRPYLGICVGMQLLFASSDESPDSEGLGLIGRKVERFDDSEKAVPHMGWGQACLVKEMDDGDESIHYGLRSQSSYYFVHSYAALYAENDHVLRDWALAISRYGSQNFVAAVQRGNVFATQFHPEKSGPAGLNVLHAFLAQTGQIDEAKTRPRPFSMEAEKCQLGLRKRIIACLDVRSNDQGDLVVTKGDQYDVREKPTVNGDGKNHVRNLGKPVNLARRYYTEGADEITFLNITSFRNCPLQDLPMLQILKETAESVFVPLTIGGGIRDTVDPDGTKQSALQVAEMYFRSGADKVSIGSDAVYVAEEWYARGQKGDGQSSIETIAKTYGCQAVVVSIDPKRIYVKSDDEVPPTHTVINLAIEDSGPDNQRKCWYQPTVKGGREGRNALDVRMLAVAVEALGAGEILLNSMDRDGTNRGYDLELIRLVKNAVKIPVIASSGAGKVEHFDQVFTETNAEAALAAGIFHRRQVPIEDVKEHLRLAHHKVREPIDTEGVLRIRGGNDAKAPKKTKNQLKREKQKAKKKVNENGRETQASAPPTLVPAQDADANETEPVSNPYEDEDLDTDPLTLLQDDPAYKDFAAVFQHFQGAGKDFEAENEEIEAKKGQVMYSDDELSDEDSDDAMEARPVSKKKQRKLARMTVAELKQMVKTPEIVEEVDTTAPDPRLLVTLKAYRNTISVPAHWSAKSAYLAGKRGIEKPKFQLPGFIADTGIATMRDALKEKENEQKLKAKTRERVQPKMGKMDIDYQKLHDAFFKFQTKPALSGFGEMYYEGKEFESKFKEKRPGELSKELVEALSIPPFAPPPWLIAMQRFGPPPSYPSLRIPGLNAPIPEGAQWGFHPGGWGKPPLDEYNRPLYGDVYGVQAQPAPSGATQDIPKELWGELEEEEEKSEEESSEEEVDDEEEEEADGPTTAHGKHFVSSSHSQTDILFTGLETPGYQSGMASVASTVPAGLETPDVIQLRKSPRQSGTVTQEPGGSQRPLYQVLAEKEQKSSGTGFMGSSSIYDIPGRASEEAEDREGISSSQLKLSKDPITAHQADAKRRREDATRTAASQPAAKREKFKF